MASVILSFSAATTVLAAEIDATPVSADAIGGTVASAAGPEAGVWVIAETDDLSTRYAKIVVTDDRGRFVLPQLPKASYRVWARGYGLTDSATVLAAPGDTVMLNPALAKDAIEAAQIYPANYWMSLIRIPDEDQFPGTGPKGNGINPTFRTSQDWVAHLKENCQICHQLGDRATRVLPDIGNPMQAWELRIRKNRGPDDPFFEGDSSHMDRHFDQRMVNVMTMFGGNRGLEMFTDWTTGVAEGATPLSPERPKGIERNLVITTWDMGDGRFLHDSISSDKLNPTVNANGPVYGFATYSGMVMSVDPATGENRNFKLLDRNGDWAKNSLPHTGTMDSRGRIWMTNIVHLGVTDLDVGGFGQVGDNPAFCTDPANRYANYFPHAAQEARLASVLDPQTGKNQFVPLCFGTHHLNFDAGNRLYFSGDTEAIGWIDVDAWDQTHDPAKSIGWCPMVLDTNGDGRITPDRAQWNLRLTGIAGGEGANLRVEAPGKETPLDPSRDTRVAGFTYGIGISPKDQSYWAARFSPYVPSGIFRVETGPNPPETCKTEYYEAPRVDGNYAAFNARGVDVDIDGVAWVAFGSGAIGRFDRSRCKVLNGPTATGQHCPEGWEIIDTPGPELRGTDIGTDWFYVAFVDNDDIFGLGEGVPIFPNSSGDELLVYLPEKKDFVHLRIPYPLGLYARGVDGRIDDPDAGWKGRGLWTSSNTIPVWHHETGEGSSEYVAQFQLRPDPLAQ